MQFESSIDGRLFYLIWMVSRIYDVKLLGVGTSGLVGFWIDFDVWNCLVSFSSLVVVVPSTSGERVCHNSRNDMDWMVCRWRFIYKGGSDLFIH